MNLFSKRMAALTLASAFLFSACGDDGDKKAASTESESAQGGTADYCAKSLTVNLGVSTLDPDASDFSDNLKAFATTAEAWLEVVPDEIKDSAQVMVDALHQVQTSGDPSVFESDEVSAADDKVHAYDVKTCDWKQVAVAAEDYKFTLTPPTSAGVISLEMSNKGQEPHLAIIGRKKDSVSGSAKDAFATADSEEKFNQSFDMVSTTFAAPGQDENGIAELTAGEYVIFCPITVGSSATGEGAGPPHFVEGMVDTFTVK